LIERCACGAIRDPSTRWWMRHRRPWPR
jgi:hypothetical protein